MALTNYGVCGLTDPQANAFGYSTIDPLTGLARLVNGRSYRGGAATDDAAPPRSRLGAELAFHILSDPGAGHTLLSADPKTAPPSEIDKIQVLGTSPAPF